MEYIIKTDSLVNHQSNIENFLETMFSSLYCDGEIDHYPSFSVEVVNPKTIDK
ncbi:MAG: hypothetical protein ACRDD7_15560 [Peptostreptococcaceae bacterium]